MYWNFENPPTLFQLNVDQLLHYTWHAFVMPNHDIGITLVNPQHYAWFNLSYMDSEAERDLGVIQHCLRRDARLKEVQHIRFQESSCSFGSFVRIGLDTDRQAAMFKLCFMGAPFGAAQSE